LEENEEKKDFFPGEPKGILANPFFGFDVPTVGVEGVDEGQEENSLLEGKKADADAGVADGGAGEGGGIESSEIVSSKFLIGLWFCFCLRRKLGCLRMEEVFVCPREKP